VVNLEYKRLPFYIITHFNIVDNPLFRWKRPTLFQPREWRWVWQNMSLSNDADVKVIVTVNFTSHTSTLSPTTPFLGGCKNIIDMAVNNALTMNLILRPFQQELRHPQRVLLSESGLISELWWRQTWKLVLEIQSSPILHYLKCLSLKAFGKINC